MVKAEGGRDKPKENDENRTVVPMTPKHTDGRQQELYERANRQPEPSNQSGSETTNRS